MTKPNEIMTYKQTYLLFLMAWNQNWLASTDVMAKAMNESDMKNIVTALSKQIPLKLVLRGKTKRCPICNKYVTDSECTKLDIKYCVKCGQLFDWNETVDEEHKGIAI